MIRVIIGEGSCGIAAGALKVHSAIDAFSDSSVSIGITGCIGMCFLEPLVDIYEENLMSHRSIIF